MPATTPAARRQAVRTSLERRFGRAVPVTEAAVDSVIAELDGADPTAGPGAAQAVATALAKVDAATITGYAGEDPYLLAVDDLVDAVRAHLAGPPAAPAPGVSCAGMGHVIRGVVPAGFAGDNSAWYVAAEGTRHATLGKWCTWYATRDEGGRLNYSAPRFFESQGPNPAPGLLFDGTANRLAALHDLAGRSGITPVVTSRSWDEPLRPGGLPDVLRVNGEVYVRDPGRP
jgi:hypothetical protein